MAANIKINVSTIDAVLSASTALDKATGRQWLAYIGVRQANVGLLDGGVTASDLADAVVAQVQQRAVSKGVTVASLVQAASLKSYWSEVSRVEKALDVKGQVISNTLVFTSKDKKFVVSNRSEAQGLGFLLKNEQTTGTDQKKGKKYTLNGDGTISVKDLPKSKPTTPTAPNTPNTSDTGKVESAEETLNKKFQEGVTLLNAGIKGVDGKYRPLTEKQQQQVAGLLNNLAGAIDSQEGDLSNTALKYVIETYKKIANLGQIKALKK